MDGDPRRPPELTPTERLHDYLENDPSRQTPKTADELRRASKLLPWEIDFALRELLERGSLYLLFLPIGPESPESFEVVPTQE